MNHCEIINEEGIFDVYSKGFKKLLNSFRTRQQAEIYAEEQNKLINAYIKIGREAI